jgi:lysophospholipase L1-like esterase
MVLRMPWRRTALALSIGLAVACGAEPGRERPVRSPSDAAARARLVGRFDRRRFAWSGSRIEARFRGAGLTMHLRVGLPEMSAADAADPAKVARARATRTAYSVHVDDRPRAEIEVSPEVDRYAVATGLSPSTAHAIAIVREAEAFGGVHELLGLEVAGGELLDPPAPKPRRIEVIGDSISCGYGVLGADASCPFSYATERASLAYPALLGELLDADVTTLCWSGRGVYRNYDAGEAPLMPALFERTVPQEPASRWPFDREGAAPDVVVVNLGTNDFFADHDRDDKPDPIDGDAFEARYVDLLARVREVRPRAAIVVTTSPMLEGEIGARSRASLDRIVRRRAAAGDKQIELVVVEEQRGRVGCDAHPDRRMHEVLAGQLASRIGRRLGLRPPGTL